MTRRTARQREQDAKALAACSDPRSAVAASNWLSRVNYDARRELDATRTIGAAVRWRRARAAAVAGLAAAKVALDGYSDVDAAADTAAYLAAELDGGES